MKQDIWNDVKLVNINVDQMHVFEIINIIEIMTNANVDVKIIVEDIIKDLFGILVVVNAIMINYVMLNSI